MPYALVSYSFSIGLVMSTNEDFGIRMAEQYAKVQAILTILEQSAEKLKEDPAKKSTKLKTTLTDLKVNFSTALEGVGNLRTESDSMLENCTLTNKDLTNMEKALRRMLALRSKLDGEEVTKTDCSKWLEELETLKVSLGRRYQIKQVDSEKQASVSSLTEQLKQRDTTIDQLQKEKQEYLIRIQELTSKNETQYHSTDKESLE